MSRLHSLDQTFVIAGASLAGAKAAETLRAEGFDGRLVNLIRERVAVDDRRLADPGISLGDLAVAAEARAA